MNLRQAAQQALEALEWAWGGEPLTGKEMVAIAALRAALAEPEQEPDGISWLKRDSGYFTAPTPRKPLTEPELHTITPTWPAPGQEWGYTEVLAFARAIERAHGIGEQHE